MRGAILRNGSPITRFVFNRKGTPMIYFAMNPDLQYTGKWDNYEDVHEALKTQWDFTDVMEAAEFDRNDPGEWTKEDALSTGIYNPYGERASILLIWETEAHQPLTATDD